jgi:hypothetical protein
MDALSLKKESSLLNTVIVTKSSRIEYTEHVWMEKIKINTKVSVENLMGKRLYFETYPNTSRRIILNWHEGVKWNKLTKGIIVIFGNTVMSHHVL